MTDAVDSPIPIWYLGHHLPTPVGTSIEQTVDASVANNYDFITTYLTNENLQTRIKDVIGKAAAEEEDHPFVDSLTADEVNVFPGHYTTQMLAYSSSWLELDSEDPLVAEVSKSVLLHEIAYASYCGITKVVILGPTRPRNASQFAEVINSALAISPFMQLLIHLPITEEDYDPKTFDERRVKGLLSSWDSWNTIRTVCNYNQNLALALQISPRLPPDHVLNRWFTEPVRLLHISSAIFILNAKGYPVLSQEHQTRLFARYMKIQPTPYILLADTAVSLCVLSPSASRNLASGTPRRDDPLSFISYIRHLQKNQAPLNVFEKVGQGYQDYLQSPLQPLADNLESITYEVFERDPVKYDQYEEAIKLALLDRDPDVPLAVAVVGAGRGPLVQRALNAEAATGRKIVMYAIEKNPNAYVTLMKRNKESWGGRVTLVKTDMRAWNPPTQIDILISELLGSFGDNELSPECLDGAQRVLNEKGGITIPASYTAHFTPIMAPKIHADLSLRKEPDAKEIPYVVLLHAVDILAKDQYIHNAWEFSHPLSRTDFSKNDHNVRRSKATFKIPYRGVVHGIAGYFESVLYGNIELSTRPDTMPTKSADMTSWFPIYFPLKTPIYVPDGSEMDVTFWRETDQRKVWYEWLAEAYLTLDNDQRARLGQSELHSSKQNGCLM